MFPFFFFFSFHMFPRCRYGVPVLRSCCCRLLGLFGVVFQGRLVGFGVRQTLPALQVAIDGDCWGEGLAPAYIDAFTREVLQSEIRMQIFVKLGLRLHESSVGPANRRVVSKKKKNGPYSPKGKMAAVCPRWYCRTNT